MGYVTYFCTDYIGLNAAIVGTLFLVSKVVDAISNFIIAYIVDNCNFKLGKGRPWELNIIPMWAMLILIFCIQDSWGLMAKYALVFLYYTLCNAVFGTFLSCTDTIYFKHTFTDENQRNRIQAFTGAIAMLAMTAGGVAMPILIAYFQDVPNGWSILALQSVLSLVSMASMASLLICVPLANKIGRVKVLKIFFALCAVSCLGRFFAGGSVAFLAICQLLAAAVTYPFNAFSPLMLIDCMDYGEWKNGKAVEGAIFAAASLGSTIGSGVGSSLGGIVVTAFGYDGTAEVQTATALFGIKFCYAIIPAILMAAVVGILFFYDLDKKMPQVREELAERRAAKANA